MCRQRIEQKIHFPYIPCPCNNMKYTWHTAFIEVLVLLPLNDLKRVYLCDAYIAWNYLFFLLPFLESQIVSEFTLPWMYCKWRRIYISNRNVTDYPKKGIPKNHQKCITYWILPCPYVLNLSLIHIWRCRRRG